MVAIKPVGGLASRLKCIASFGAFATYFRVPLHVCWEGSVGFEEIEWTNLLDATPADIQWLTPARWNTLRSKTLHMIPLERYISYLNNDYRYSFYRLDELFRTRKPYRITAVCNRDLQKLYGGVLTKYIPSFRTQYMDRMMAFRPCAAIRERVGDEVREWIRIACSESSESPDTTPPTTKTAGTATTTAMNVLGVHLRRNDALQSNLSHRYTTPSEAECEAAIDAHLAKSSSHLVFLSTDDAGVYERFHTRYATQPRVRSFPWKRYAQNIRAQKHGQRKAMVDLWTLRCCDRVVGSYFSVFYEVGQMRLKMSREGIGKEWGTGETCTTTPTSSPPSSPSSSTSSAPTLTKALTKLLHAIHTFDDEPEPQHVIEQRRLQQAQLKEAQTAAQEAKAAVQTLVDHAKECIQDAQTAVVASRASTDKAHQGVIDLTHTLQSATLRIIHQADRAHMACRGARVNAVLLRKRVLGPLHWTAPNDDT